MFRATVTMTTLLLALAPTLTACGDDETTDEPLATETARNGDVYNAADVAFATALIPLDAEALALVDMTLDRDLSPQAQAVADDISLTSTAEIEEMTTWLTNWDQPIPETVRDHVNAGHGDDGHGDDGQGGSDGHGSEALDELAAADDAEFEAVFVDLIADNRAEAVEVAEAETEDGAFGPALDLARSVIERGAPAP